MKRKTKSLKHTDQKGLIKKIITTQDIGHSGTQHSIHTVLSHFPRQNISDT